MDRKIVDVLKEMPEQQKFLRGQISWAGFRQTYIEYDRDQRNAGETGYTYKKMIRFALDGITGFSNLPLKFATIAEFDARIKDAIGVGTSSSEFATPQTDVTFGLPSMAQ